MGFYTSDFNGHDIYDNIYDENEYEAVLVYRQEMDERNKPKKDQKTDKETLEDYKT